MTTPKHTELPESQLLACPFCGGTASLIVLDGFQILCDDNNCLMDVSTWPCLKREEAIHAWNTRYNQHAELIRQRDELAAAVKLAISQIPEIRSHGDYFEQGIIAQLEKALTPTKEK